MSFKKFKKVRIGDLAYHSDAFHAEEDKHQAEVGKVVWKGYRKDLLHSEYSSLYDNWDEDSKDFLEDDTPLVVIDDQSGMHPVLSLTLFGYNVDPCSAVVPKKKID